MQNLGLATGRLGLELAPCVDLCMSVCGDNGMSPIGMAANWDCCQKRVYSVTYETMRVLDFELLGVGDKQIDEHVVLAQRGCVCDSHAAWECNVLQGAAGVSDTMLLVLVRPVCTGQRRGPAPGGKDHPPGGMPGRSNHEPGCMAARSYPL